MVITAGSVGNSLFPRSFDSVAGLQQKSWYPGTKEIFIYGSDPGPTPGQYAYFLTWQIGPTGGEGNVTFRCPHDFNAILKGELLYFPDATHSGTDIDINVSFASEGQDADGRDETNTTGTYSGTIKQLTAIDITDMLLSMKVNDCVGINIINNHATMTMKFLGLRLQYR